MTLTIDIEPELGAALARQAASQGVDLDSYAARLLEDAVRSPESGKISTAQIDEFLREMAWLSEKIPTLPDEAFSRASIYGFDN